MGGITSIGVFVKPGTLAQRSRGAKPSSVAREQPCIFVIPVIAVKGCRAALEEEETSKGKEI